MGNGVGIPTGTSPYTSTEHPSLSLSRGPPNCERNNVSGSPIHLYGAGFEYRSDECRTQLRRFQVRRLTKTGRLRDSPICHGGWSGLRRPQLRRPPRHSPSTFYLRSPASWDCGDVGAEGSGHRKRRGGPAGVRFAIGRHTFGRSQRVRVTTLLAARVLPVGEHRCARQSPIQRSAGCTTATFASRAPSLWPPRCRRGRSRSSTAPRAT